MLEIACGLQFRECDVHYSEKQPVLFKLIEELAPGSGVAPPTFQAFLSLSVLQDPLSRDSLPSWLLTEGTAK